MVKVWSVVKSGDIISKQQKSVFEKLCARGGVGNCVRVKDEGRRGGQPNADIG